MTFSTNGGSCGLGLDATNSSTHNSSYLQLTAAIVSELIQNPGEALLWKTDFSLVPQMAQFYSHYGDATEEADQWHMESSIEELRCLAG